MKTAIPITFGSLFSGVGGMDLGFERAGLSCSYQVEINDYASRVLAKHWPDVVRFRDVREVGKRNLPYADVIGGGFPCQGISYAGKGMGLADERSGLWYEFARIIREMEPKVVVVENVNALLTRGLDAVLGTLASLGLDAEWHCIPAAAVGAPHRRDRVFIIAYRNRSRQLQPQGLVKDERRRPGDCVATDVSDTASRRVQREIESGSETWRSGSSLRWSAEPGVSGVAYGVPYRLDRNNSLGNAIVPQVAEYVARQFVLPGLAVAA